jgi:hypothetical protein
MTDNPESTEPWWMENNLRLIQTNLREPDARLDLDRLLSQLDDFSANAWRLNTGGIVAFYPTDLKYHYQTPYLEGDLIGDAIQRAHANDIRIISRFDFSKVHEDIYEENPEWAYRTADGEIVNYHGIVHMCVNGGYQREYSLEILEEVLSRYDVDGIFFNMFGYQHWDYSRNYYGPCHCENCRQRFREFFDTELPDTSELEGSAAQQYQEFQDRTVREMLDSVRTLVDGHDRDIAVSTYTPYNVDIVTKESNTSLDQDPPKWLYSASENVASLEDSWDNKVVSNLCVNAVDLPYRFMSVSQREVQTRLYQSIASGSGLDFYINGIFDGYPDRSNFDTIKEIYQFHQDNEERLGNFESEGQIVLLKPDRESGEQRQSYRGLFKMLKEAHLLFDVIDQRNLIEMEDRLRESDLVLVPGMHTANDDEMDALRTLHGVDLIATDHSFTESASERAFLKDAFGVRIEGDTEEIRGAYLETADKDIFERFPEQDWIFLDGNFSFVEFEEDVATFLPYITPAVYGPPERVGYDGNDRSDYRGAGTVDRDGSERTYLPWEVGQLYYEHGYESHKNAVLDLVDNVLDDQPSPLTTDAPSTVEIFFDGVDTEVYLFQLLNLSGFNGTTYFDPVPVEEITTTLRGLGDPTAISSLTGGRFEHATIDGDLQLRSRDLDLYDAIEIEL